MQNLSSAQTFFFKFVFLAFWSGMFAIGALSVLLNPPEQRHPTGWPIAVIWILGTALLWATCGRLKRVALDGQTLVISNYLRAVRVPASEIAQVSQNRLFSLRPVTIVFKRPTAFGTRISFMPPTSFRFFGEDDVVATLRNLAAGTRSAP